VQVVRPRQPGDGVDLGRPGFGDDRVAHRTLRLPAG
jgi:hypothetical protein